MNAIKAEIQHITAVTAEIIKIRQELMQELQEGK